MGTTSSSLEKETDFQHVWCQACCAIVHKEECMHRGNEKRPLLDVVHFKEAKAQCHACYQHESGWFVQYACGHLVHLDICYQQETCPELCPTGTLLDPANLSPQLRLVRKNRQVKPQTLRLPAFFADGLPLIALSARYLSSGGHLHVALHTDSQPEPFYLYPQDTLFPVCDTGNHLSRYLQEYLERNLGLPTELPHGLLVLGSPFQQQHKESTGGLFFGYRPTRRVYLCFGATLGFLLKGLADNSKNTAVVCFSGAYDYHRHLQRRPPALTIPASTSLVQGITSVHADVL